MYRMGACKGCKERREALATLAKNAKQIVTKVVTKPKGQK